MTCDRFVQAIIWILSYFMQCCIDASVHMHVQREKGREQISPVTRAPLPIQKSKVTTQKRVQKFDYTAIADRLWTVTLGNDSHPTVVVKPVYGPNLPTPASIHAIHVACSLMKATKDLAILLCIFDACISGKVTHMSGVMWPSSDQNLGHLDINKGCCYLWCWEEGMRYS